MKVVSSDADFVHYLYEKVVDLTGSEVFGGAKHAHGGRKFSLKFFTGRLSVVFAIDLEQDDSWFIVKIMLSNHIEDIHTRRDLKILDRDQVGDVMVRFLDDVFELVEHQIEPVMIQETGAIFSKRFNALDYYMISEELQQDMSLYVGGEFTPHVTCVRSGEFEVTLRTAQGQEVPSLRLPLHSRFLCHGVGDVPPNKAGDTLLDVMVYWNTTLHGRKGRNPVLYDLMKPENRNGDVL